MAERMTLEQVYAQERFNSGTSKTNNDDFEKNGYIVVKDLWDPSELYRPVPVQRGQMNYWGTKLDQYTFTDLENQVEGSHACYWHPQYRQIHSQIRLKLEKLIGKKLYNTYYYDRFYFEGQQLTIHADRDACEISVTTHISTNLKEPWPIWIKTPDKDGIIGENRSVVLSAGDGMVYKGCERPHWRDPMPKTKRLWKLFKKEEVYYHQVFFHYVLADGLRAQCAFDASR